TCCDFIASISDFILSFFVYWILASIFIAQSEAIIVTSLAAAFYTTCVEPFNHVYILEQFSNFKGGKDHEAFAELQTEFAEEMDINVERNKQDDFKQKNNK